MISTTTTTASGGSATLESERGIDSHVLSQLVAYLERARTIIGLRAFDFRVVSGVTFRYYLETRDGRAWRQVLVFDDPDDPLMTFDVSQGFRATEFSAQRDIRSQLIACRASCGLIRLTVIWP